jgi:TM2 domain-containing membrane protein YozV
LGQFWGISVGDIPINSPDQLGTSSQRVPAAISSGASGPPPHPLDSQWHIHANGEIYGPYTGHQLGEYIKEGRIDGGTQVRAVGSEDWTLLGQDRHLSALARSVKQITPPPISAAAGATVVHVTNQIAAPAMLMDDMGAFGPKSPAVALLLSFFICGAGQMYCRKVGKGILMLIGCIVLWIIMLGWVIWIWSMIDAYSTAKDMNLRYLRRLQAGQLV